MSGLKQVQELLERVLGGASLPFHDSYWRGKTREELLKIKLYNLSLFVPGKIEDSAIMNALGQQNSSNSRAENLLITAHFKNAKLEEGDLAFLGRWISDGCPEVSIDAGLQGFNQKAASIVEDMTHVKYWREIDGFFLPNHASEETKPHVIKMYGQAITAWVNTFITEEDSEQWARFAARPDVVESVSYIRHHQRRFIHEYYENTSSALFDSLWKFGGNLLPIDPLSLELPNHTMNGVSDWFHWSPYLMLTLSDPDVQAIDVELARAWQIGIVADGLLRSDSERTGNNKMPISDFQLDDPNLFSSVSNKYKNAQIPELSSEMIRRGREFMLS